MIAGYRVTGIPDERCFRRAWDPNECVGQIDDDSVDSIDCNALVDCSRSRRSFRASRVAQVGNKTCDFHNILHCLREIAVEH